MDGEMASAAVSAEQDRGGGNDESPAEKAKPIIKLELELKLRCLLRMHSWEEARERIRRNRPVRILNVDKARLNSDLQYRLTISLFQRNFGKELRFRDSYGMYPLHHACYENAPPDIVELLIQACKYSVTRVDFGNGDLPLHISCNRQQTRRGTTEANSGGEDESNRTRDEWTVANALARRFPDTILKTNKDGSTALHYALEFDPPTNLIQTMVGARPKVCKKRDGQHQLPLHVALNYRCHVDIIRILVDAFPSSVFQSGNQGYLPLHFAAFSGARIGVIDLLLEKYPGAVWKQKPCSPLHLIFSVAKGDADDDDNVRREVWKKFGSRRRRRRRRRATDDDGSVSGDGEEKEDDNGDDNRGSRNELCSMADMVKLMLFHGCRAKKGKSIKEAEALKRIVSAKDGRGYNVYQVAESVRLCTLSEEEERPVIPQRVLDILKDAERGELTS